MGGGLMGLWPANRNHSYYHADMSPLHEASPPPVVSSDMASCPANPPLPTQSGAPAPTLRLSSRALLGGRQEVEIDHDGVVYRLRHTALGKLILTK